ncbi:MAG: acyltransferase [Cyanobacteria bacterium P01_F01_bin.53]
MEIRKLNMLRGLAASVVVMSHYSNHTELFNKLLGDSAGQLGVMIFFVLSGFLMSYLYMDTKKANKENLKYFIFARVARVVPLFVGIVLVSYFMPLFGIKHIFYHIPDATSLISHLGLLHGNSVLWTVSTEIQFYALFIVFWIVQEKRKLPLYIFFSAVLIILMFYGLPAPRLTVVGWEIDTKLVRSLPYFLMGVVFGQIYKSWTPPKSLHSGGFVFSLAIILALYPNVFRFLTGQYHQMWQDIRIFTMVSLVFFLIAFLVPDENLLLANPVGDFLGKISYSVYLLHLPILRSMDAIALSPMPSLVVFTGLLLVVSYLSYRFIESPSRQFLRSLAFRQHPLTNA